MSRALGCWAIGVSKVRERERTEHLVHRGDWIAYYGDSGEQTLLDDSRYSSETTGESRG